MAAEVCEQIGTFMVKLNVNGQLHDVASEPDTPLLYALREDLALNGAKYGCSADRGRQSQIDGRVGWHAAGLAMALSAGASVQDGSRARL